MKRWPHDLKAQHFPASSVGGMVYLRRALSSSFDPSSMISLESPAANQYTESCFSYFHRVMKTEDGSDFTKSRGVQLLGAEGRLHHLRRLFQVMRR